MEQVNVSPETVDEVWAMVERATTEQEKRAAFVKISAAMVPSIRQILAKSEFRTNCVIEHIADGCPAIIPISTEYDSTYVLYEQRAVTSVREIPDTELISKQLLTKDKLPNICQQMANELLDQEWAAYECLAVAVGDRPHDKCQLYIRRDVDIIPAFDIGSNNVSLIAFELLCMALPFKSE